ncbi:C40 family peptidase [Nonomuraea sp. NPDC049421]|uniref:C40 family peptidase n=1 Tax=Nonomuraea sp. NPDC049421 TaxID=3155275 RepID=UPI003442C5AB
MRVRAAAVSAVVCTMALALPGPAMADPSPAQARARLVKLNEKADQLVERYNRASEAYKTARDRYRALDAEAAADDARAEELRAELADLAARDYQLGSPLSWQRFVGSGDPEAVLGGMAALEQLARDRAARLRAFESATARLRQKRDRAKAVLAEADEARDEVRREQAQVDKLVDQQTALLRRLGAFKTGDPQSTGKTYTGPASGNARRALEFAFAQIGKPYRYGGTGPGSWDCSGLVQAAWRAAGVKLPRTTYTQWSWGAARRVPVTAAQPGDLLFSRGLGHMGMYVGDGKMVHAPQTGDVVKIVTLDGYWRNRLIGAVRP